jgi:hypothetical protein
VSGKLEAPDHPIERESVLAGRQHPVEARRTNQARTADFTAKSRRRTARTAAARQMRQLVAAREAEVALRRRCVAQQAQWWQGVLPQAKAVV